jgi:UDP-N-acetylmuramoylalanine--D-glutamate ligase
MEHVLIIGLGITGKATAHYLAKKGGFLLYAAEDKIEKRDPSLLPEDITILSSGKALSYLENIDIVIPSPGIPPTNPLYRAALERNIPIISDIDLVFRDKSTKCLGITGTNGKTTVTSMTEHSLCHAGCNTIAAGNIGLPITSPALDDKDLIIMELSSFQLDIMNTLCLDAAVILNISPDHGDRYSSFEEYVASKFSIQNFLKDDGKLFIERSTAERYKHLITRETYYCFDFTDETHSKVRITKNLLAGDESVEYISTMDYKKDCGCDKDNALASYTLCREEGITLQQHMLALQSFRKAPHRIEYVRTYDGIEFYNDSKATNAEAVIKAVESIDKDIVLIVGGADKGLSYDVWKGSLPPKVKNLIAIGELAAPIYKELGATFDVIPCSSLEEAVHCSRRYANDGGAVLLSPGSSSYDMFTSYEHRGEEFKRIVNAL